MRKHDIPVFEGTLKSSIDSGTLVERSIKSETGITYKSKSPTLAGASSGLAERVRDYLNKMQAEKKNFFAKVSDPIPSSASSGNHLIMVHASWDEEDVPVAHSALPDHASTSPKVRM